MSDEKEITTPEKMTLEVVKWTIACVICATTVAIGFFVFISIIACACAFLTGKLAPDAVERVFAFVAAFLVSSGMLWAFLWLRKQPMQKGANNDDCIF